MLDRTHRRSEGPRGSDSRGRRDDRAVQELADHLEELYQEALDRGASEEEAREYVRSGLIPLENTENWAAGWTDGPRTGRTASGTGAASGPLWRIEYAISGWP